jgi:hypothetical protein
MNKKELVAKFKSEYPTLKRGSDENGYEEISVTEYEEIISQWADNELQKLTVEAEAEAKAVAKGAAQAKLAALGLTVEDLQALGL